MHSHGDGPTRRLVQVPQATRPSWHAWPGAAGRAQEAPGQGPRERPTAAKAAGCGCLPGWRRICIDDATETTTTGRLRVSKARECRDMELFRGWSCSEAAACGERSGMPWVPPACPPAAFCAEFPHRAPRALHLSSPLSRQLGAWSRGPCQAMEGGACTQLSHSWFAGLADAWAVEPANGHA
eukprot:361448-Chlamydomonas_euryale.AAC.4